MSDRLRNTVKSIVGLLLGSNAQVAHLRSKWVKLMTDERKFMLGELASRKRSPATGTGPSQLQLIAAALPELLIVKDMLKMLTLGLNILGFEGWFYSSKTNKTYMQLSLLAVLPSVALLSNEALRENMW